jgi:hypothetical protein
VKLGKEIYIKIHRVTVISKRADPQLKLHYTKLKIDCFKFITNCQTNMDKFYTRDEYIISSNTGASGGAVVGALRYKPEGRGIDSQWCHWNFSLT